MRTPDTYYRDDLLEKRPSSIGMGVFAKVAIEPNTLLGCLSPGQLAVLEIRPEGVDYGAYPSGQTIDLAIEGNKLICLVKDDKDLSLPDFINHSCTPNCEVVSRLLVYSRARIERDEAVTVDYLACGITLLEEGIPCKCRPGCQSII